MRILLSNDDGFHAPGLQALAARLRELGEVWIVAPDAEQSGTSHSISLHRPLRVRRMGEREFTVDGTPTDSVYIGLHQLMKDKPDLVVSGINHGPNLGSDVIYSGTVSAAMEAAIFGYRAMAVSLAVADNRDARHPTGPHFATAAEVAAGLAANLADKPMPRGVLLNVNVPDVPPAEIRGVKLCRLGLNDWAEEVTERFDPRGKPYYWIGGQRIGHDEVQDSDINALTKGLVAMTPIHYDLTDYRSFAFVRGLEPKGFARVADELGDRPLAHPVVKTG